MSEVDTKGCRRAERPRRRPGRVDAERAIDQLRLDVRKLTDRIAELQEKLPRREPT